jgi:hypothetical protein
MEARSARTSFPGFVAALEEKGAETLLGDHLADCPKKLSSRQSSGKSW